MPPSATATDIDQALMRLPYGEWIPMPAAAQLLRELGLPSRALTTVVRSGRRRGVLRTLPTPSAHLIKRVYDAPYRPKRPSH
ncbi:hypothetical protein [Streptomyces sp. NPDC046685]|uniref:hypothetical protein n=1 Tax=Streptomyces sp. NPDC046685 TaxID=3157202 RepID=UPI0033E821C0